MAALAARPAIPVLDGRALLARSKNWGPLYFQTDTHWNELGAFIALSRALLRAGLPASRMIRIGDYRIAPGIRQAFSALWLKVLSNNFGRVERGIYPTIRHDDLIVANSPDVIILELVERGIPYWSPARG